MKLTKTFVIPVAGLLVVLGAGAVLREHRNFAGRRRSGRRARRRIAVAGRVRSAPKREFQDPALTSVLADLVAKGTITAAQQQAILDGLAGRARAAPRGCQGADGSPPGAGARRSRASSPTARSRRPSSTSSPPTARSASSPT